MKIAYLLQEGSSKIDQNVASGPVVHVQRVIHELHAMGHQVKIIYKQKGKTWKSDNLTEFQPTGPNPFDKGILNFSERFLRRIQSDLHLPYLGLFESIKFALTCKAEFVGFDILFERMGWMGYGGAFASRWLKIPWVLEVNGDPITEMQLLGNAPRGFQLWLSQKIMRRAINRAWHIVASGDGWRRRYIEKWSVYPEKITTVENGSEVVDLLNRDQLAVFGPQPLSSQVTLVYLGGFQPWQGVTILIRAFARALSLGCPIELKLIGTGPNLGEIEQLVKDLGIQDQVVFTGKMTPVEYAPHLAQAQIGAAPYCGWAEFSGLKILDYKSAGLAIITSGRDGLPATISHGKTGWIVPPCAEDKLAEAIVHLAADPELRKKMGQAAREEAEREHHWSNTAGNLDRLLEQVAREPQRK